MIFLKFIGRSLVPVLDDAEEAAWLAENPAPDVAIVNSESGHITWVDEDGVQQFITFGGGGAQVYSIYERGHSGSAFVATSLIGAEIVLFLLDGLPRYLVASTPDAGSEFTFDSTTGTISIGTDFDGNDIIITYKGNAPSI